MLLRLLCDSQAQHFIADAGDLLKIDAGSVFDVALLERRCLGENGFFTAVARGAGIGDVIGGYVQRTLGGLERPFCYPKRC